MNKTSRPKLFIDGKFWGYLYSFNTFQPSTKKYTAVGNLIVIGEVSIPNGPVLMSVTWPEVWGRKTITLKNAVRGEACQGFIDITKLDNNLGTGWSFYCL
jgi:hypothetical protein